MIVGLPLFASLLPSFIVRKKWHVTAGGSQATSKTGRGSVRGRECVRRAITTWLVL